MPGMPRLTGAFKDARARRSIFENNNPFHISRIVFPAARNQIPPLPSRRVICEKKELQKKKRCNNLLLIYGGPTCPSHFSGIALSRSNDRCHPQWPDIKLSCPPPEWVMEAGISSPISATFVCFSFGCCGQLGLIYRRGWEGIPCFVSFDECRIEWALLFFLVGLLENCLSRCHKRQLNVRIVWGVDVVYGSPCFIKRAHKCLEI
ncbi:hypothetical protein NPIL_634741 [Nephila pilipes]|uniref:Uncharacterized protein n=1 Tax=Nephila pilipes TaxID=299642 RepID=A0A8X6MPF8_NEPPI|nr:hypothetical protein NPIL_634741 [Nephila pilipes]